MSTVCLALAGTGKKATSRDTPSLPSGAEGQVESPFCLESLSPCGAIPSRADTWVAVAEVWVLPRQHGPGLDPRGVLEAEAEVCWGSWVFALQPKHSLWSLFPPWGNTHLPGVPLPYPLPPLLPWGNI